MARAAAIAAVAALCLAAPAFVAGQDSVFVGPALARDLANEVSGDRAYETVRGLSHFHRIMGTPEFVRAARWLAGQAEACGLRNIVLEEQPFPGRPSWDLKSGEMWVIEPERLKIADFVSQPVSIAVFSRSAHLTAELVDVGEAREEDFAGLDVRGKVVLTIGSPGLAMQNAVWARGALGLVSAAGIRSYPQINTPDQVAYMKVPTWSRDGKPGTWGVMITPRRYYELRDLIRSAARRGTAVKVRVDIDAEYVEPGRQAHLLAEIPGTEIHDQDIVLTAHLDEERTSANDNGSGCGSQLEVGRAINALIASGRVAPPRRDIVFWWPNEHTSEYEYFKEHPEAPRTMLANINQDMVGARQSQGSRVQHLILTPWSIPSYLNDVVSSIVESVIQGNNGFLSASEVPGTPYPYPRPLLSFRGSREAYHAMIVPHVGASDQEVFCEGVIGVPGVGLINEPDFYIHSSADDLDNIDATQLQRNAFIVAAATLYLASAGDDDVPVLAGEVYSRGLGRLGRDLGVALRRLSDGGEGGPAAEAVRDARNLVRQAVRREAGAIESVLAFAAPGGRSERFVRDRAADVRGREAGLLEEVDRLARLLSGGKPVPAPRPTAAEAAAAGQVPVNCDSLRDYFDRRGWAIGGGALHSVIAKECYSLVDGRRSYLDIYDVVRAQALSAGAWYYGDVRLEDVCRLLDDGVAKGVLKLASSSR